MAIDQEPNILISFQGKKFEAFAEPTIMGTLFSNEEIHPEVSEYNDYSDFSEDGSDDENCYSTDLYILLERVGSLELKLINRVLSI